MLTVPIDQLTIADKYQIIMQLQEQQQTPDEAGTDVMVINGKKYQRVEIDGDEGNEYLMDEENNIYDMELNFVGQMGGDDDDQWNRLPKLNSTYILTNSIMVFSGWRRRSGLESNFFFPLLSSILARLNQTWHLFGAV